MTMPYEKLIGRTWSSKEGPRKVVGVREVGGKTRLLIQTGDSNQHQLLPPDELEQEIKLDASRLARGTAPAAPAGPTFDDAGFLATLSPMQAARAKAALLKSRTFRGGLHTVADIISRLVKSGSRVQTSSSGRRLTAQDGSYLDEKALTKVGLDFAEYLTRTNEAATTPSELDEMDVVLAIGALGSVGVGSAVGLGVVRAVRTIKELLALGKTTAAEKAYDRLSKDEKATLRQLVHKHNTRESIVEGEKRLDGLDGLVIRSEKKFPGYAFEIVHEKSGQPVWTTYRESTGGGRYNAGAVLKLNEMYAHARDTLSGVDWTREVDVLRKDAAAQGAARAFRDGLEERRNIPKLRSLASYYRPTSVKREGTEHGKHENPPAVESGDRASARWFAMMPSQADMRRLRNIASTYGGDVTSQGYSVTTSASVVRAIESAYNQGGRVPNPIKFKRVADVDEVENDYGQLAQDLIRAVGDAKAVQARFLKSKGMTIEQARKLSKAEREAFQRDYTEWLKTNESLDEYTAEWPSALPIGSETLSAGVDTVITWPIQTRQLKPGEAYAPRVVRDEGWLLRNYERVRSFTVERARGDNPNIDCVVIAHTNTAETVALAFASKAEARVFLEQPCFDGKRVTWFGSEQVIGESVGWRYGRLIHRTDALYEASTDAFAVLLLWHAPSGTIAKPTAPTYLVDAIVTSEEAARLISRHLSSFNEKNVVVRVKCPGAPKDRAAYARLGDKKVIALFKAIGASEQGTLQALPGDPVKFDESLDEGQAEKIARAFHKMSQFGGMLPQHKALQLAQEMGISEELAAKVVDKASMFLGKPKDPVSKAAIAVIRQLLRAEGMDEGRTSTPPYVYEMFNAAGAPLSTFAMAWRVSGRGANNPGMGKPNAANLQKAIDGYNESLKPGGANDHIPEMIPGKDHVAAGAIVRRNEGAQSEIVAKVGKLPARYAVSESVERYETLSSFDAASKALPKSPVPIDGAFAKLYLGEFDGNEPVVEAVSWGKPYGGSYFVTPEGTRVRMFRKGVRVRFYTDDGEQVGPEQSNVAPAIAAAMHAGWRDEGVPFKPSANDPVFAKSVKLRLKKIDDEWVVQWIENGKVNDAKSYYTDDKQDAQSTMADMQRRIDASESTFQASNGSLVEVSPPGFKGTVKALKKHGEISNPYALAWWMKKRGAKSTYKADGTKKKGMAESDVLGEAFAEERDVLLALAPHLHAPRSLDEAVGVEAVEMMRISTRPKPSKEPVMSPLVAQPYDSSQYATYCVYSDGTVVRDQYRDGRQTRTVVAEVKPENIAGVVEALRAIVTSYAGKDTIADVSFTISESEGVDESEVAKTILAQLGGNRFVAMTGAKGFVGSDNSLRFQIGRNKSGANIVVIRLNAMDTYDVEFLSSRNSKVVEYLEDIYAENLRDAFTRVTGLETSLGTMGRRPTNEATADIHIPTDSYKRVVASLSQSDREALRNIRMRSSSDGKVFSPASDAQAAVVRRVFGIPDKSVDEAETEGIAYLTGDDAEKAIKSIGSPNTVSVSAWLRRNLADLKQAGWQDGGEFEDDYESTAYVVTANGRTYTVRIGDDFVSVVRGVADESEVRAAGTISVDKLREAAEPVANVRRVLTQNAGNYLTAKQIAMATGLAESDVLRAASRLVTTGEARFKRGDGYAIAGVALPVKAQPAGKIVDRRTYDYAQADAEKARARAGLRESDGYAVVRGEDDSLEYWTGDDWTSAKSEARLFGTKSESDAEADRLESESEADETTVSSGVGGFRSCPLGKNPKPPINIGSVPDVEADTDDEEDEDESIDEASKSDALLSVLRNEPPKESTYPGWWWLHDLSRAVHAHSPSDLRPALTRFVNSGKIERNAENGNYYRLSAKSSDESIDEARYSKSDVKAARAYVAAIKNEAKKAYAEKYLAHLVDGGPAPERPPSAELSYMAVQAVQMELARLGINRTAEESMGARPKVKVYAPDRKTVIAEVSAQSWSTGAAKAAGYESAARERVDGVLAWVVKGAKLDTKDESMGVGDTSIEVVKRKGKWYVVHPDGRSDAEFDDRASAVAAAQGLARRENYAVVVTIGEARGVDESHGSSDNVDVQWQDGKYTVTPPRGWDMASTATETFDDIESAFARALELARENFWIVLVWNLKPGDTPPYIGQAGADGNSAQESVEFAEAQLEGFALAAQTLDIPRGTPVNYEQGRFTVVLPAPQAARVRDLLGVC